MKILLQKQNAIISNQTLIASFYIVTSERTQLIGIAKRNNKAHNDGAK